jgi:hypothetical protein
MVDFEMVEITADTTTRIATEMGRAKFPITWALMEVNTLFPGFGKDSDRKHDDFQFNESITNGKVGVLDAERQVQRGGMRDKFGFDGPIRE